MLHEKDKEIISHLRANARKSLTEISKETGIPVTTIFDRLRIREQDAIERYTCLLNFRNLGFHTHARIAVKVNNKEEFEEYVRNHPAVNSVERINFNHDYMIHVVVHDIEELKQFLKSIERFGIERQQVYHVLEDIEKEKILRKNENKK